MENSDILGYDTVIGADKDKGILRMGKNNWYIISRGFPICHNSSNTSVILIPLYLLVQELKDYKK